MAWELVAEQVRAFVPHILSVIEILILCGITAIVARAIENRKWKEKIYYHLPDLARQKIAGAEAERDYWIAEAKRLESQNEKLTVAVRGARACLNLSIHVEADR
jgi:hypothetical protein